MIFQFKTGDVTFFEDDQDYFEKRLSSLIKYLRKEADSNPDAIDVRVTIEKNRHHTGEKFECSAHVICPRNGKFHAEVTSENIKKCADELYEKLKPQAKKFQEKH